MPLKNGKGAKTNSTNVDEIMLMNLSRSPR